MKIRRDQNYRESWYVTNQINKKINIGDLPLVPTINPGKRVDLLKFYSREKISHSIILVKLCNARILQLNKKKIYNGNDIIPPQDADAAITPVEENELENSQTDLSDYYTKEEVDDLLVDTVEPGEEITDDSEGILAFGEDINETAQPITLTGAENNELKIASIDMENILEKILIELKKANIQMSLMTDQEIKDKEIGIFS